MSIKELLTRGIDKIYNEDELKLAFKKEKKLKIYYGVDPSGAIIHLGHYAEIKKLADFQKLGHKIIFLIGDFTGMIGDPTDRNAARQPLTRKQVLDNAKDYQKQISKFLKFSGKNAAVIRFNSEWLDNLNFKEIIELSANFTVQQMLERDMFEKRIKEEKPIHLHEFLYPLMQGYDAVSLDADVQVGGTDQTFNMLAGRQLLRQIKNKIHTVITCPLLEGTDGRKMSKSFNNFVGITDEPLDMYGKIMSLSDDLIIRYFTLVTSVSLNAISKLEKSLEKGKNPKDIKSKLAFEIVKELHSIKDAEKAQKEFNNIFAEKQIPKDIPEIKLKKEPIKLIDVLFSAKMVSSKSDARRLVEQGAVDVDGATIYEKDEEITPYKNMIIKVGKRRWIKIIV